MTDYVGWYGSPRRQDWRTPRSIFDPLHAEFRFDLDGAAEDHNALLPDASTPEEPKPWMGRRVFCNPPWSAIAPFVEEAPSAEVAVLLVPARVNARWFHRALELGATPRFFLRRPSFGNVAHTGKGHNSPVDCLLLVFAREMPSPGIAPSPDAPDPLLREYRRGFDAGIEFQRAASGDAPREGLRDHLFAAVDDVRDKLAAKGQPANPGWARMVKDNIETVLASESHPTKERTE